MVDVYLQYARQDKSSSTCKFRLLSTYVGIWEVLPEIGDEIEIEDIVLIVKKRRWKIESKAWENYQRVALKCEIKND